MFLNFNRKRRIQKNTSSQEFSALPADVLRAFNKTRLRDASKRLCNAPFRNMYFDPDGNVYVCCYNQKKEIGIFPENTLDEIWAGEPINDLRKYISNNDLSAGCNECRSALLSGQFGSAHIPFYDNYFALAEKPTFMEFQLSNTCNLECTMCTGELSSMIASGRETRKPRKDPYGQNFVTQLAEFIPSLKYALFTGGEPFLNPIYFEMWERIISINPSCIITIQTNGTLLNDRIKKVLAKGNFHIGISLDSLDEKKYSTIRPNASLQSVLNNISYFNDYCKTNRRFIGISVCPMQQNWEEIPAILNFCNESEIEVYFNTVWFPGKNALWVLGSRQLGNIHSELSRKENLVLVSSDRKNASAYQNLLLSVEKWKNSALQWENYQPDSVDRNIIKEIEDEVLLRITESIQKISAKSDESLMDEIETITCKMKHVFNSIPDNDLKLKSLKTISGYRDEKILANIYRETDEGLIELVKQIHRMKDL